MGVRKIHARTALAPRVAHPTPPADRQDQDHAEADQETAHVPRQTGGEGKIDGTADDDACHEGRQETTQADETNHPREVVEAALAHVVQNKVEAAYARSDLFERRHRLMDDWAAYLDSERGQVIPLRR